MKFPKVDFDYIASKLWAILPSDFSVLITGASGYLGSYFIEFFRYLNSIGYNIHIEAVDNFISGFSDDLVAAWKKDKNVIFKHIDITDDTKLYSLNKVDYVLNCAGIASPNVYKNFPIETLDVSYIGTKNILESNEDAKSILLFSSSEVCGTPTPDKIPSKEDYVGNIPTTGNRACYDLGKMVIECLTDIYFSQKNLPVKCVRPFNVYGYVSAHDTRVLPNFIKSVLNNQNLRVYGPKDDPKTRTFCFISDAIIGFLQVLFSKYNGQIFNIGNPSPEIKINDLADLVLKISANKNIFVENIPYPEYYPDNEPLRRCPDISKAQKLVKYNPEVDLESGIKKYFQWAKLYY